MDSRTIFYKIVDQYGLVTVAVVPRLVMLSPCCSIVLHDQAGCTGPLGELT